MEDFLGIYGWMEDRHFGLLEAQQMVVICWSPDTSTSLLIFRSKRVDRVFLFLTVDEKYRGVVALTLHTWGPYPLACPLLPCAILQCSSYTFR